eukprot:309182-Chlamydomonas_euryale.AAC.1
MKLEHVWEGARRVSDVRGAALHRRRASAHRRAKAHCGIEAAGNSEAGCLRYRRRNVWTRGEGGLNVEPWASMRQSALSR